MAGEKRLQDKVLKDLRSYGRSVVVFKIEKTSDNGVPDIFFTTLLTGAVFVEMKDCGKEPEPIQKLMIKKLKKCGVNVFSCDSWKKWIDIKNFLNLNPKNISQVMRLFKN